MPDPATTGNRRAAYPSPRRSRTAVTESALTVRITPVSTQAIWNKLLALHLAPPSQWMTCPTHQSMPEDSTSTESPTRTDRKTGLSTSGEN